jgi:protein-L-isoaspartate(D-aspartate) O-methyltransferase
MRGRHLAWALAASLGGSACGDTARQRQVFSPDAQADNRERMVERQLRARDITHPGVLEAMGRVPRERFMPEDVRDRAYDDTAVPIGEGQTISQPYIVAYMTQALEPSKSDRVLEIGTGSGYQAAILAELAGEVYTIEIVPELARRAAATLRELGYGRVHTREGDGYAGWPEAAPFDRIILTAAPEEIPQALVDQLAIGGILIAPVGRGYQVMTIVRKTPGGIVRRETIDVVFVPMVKGRGGT